MKKVIGLLLFASLLLTGNSFSQSNNLDKYEGTWQWSNNDSIFTVILKKVQVNGKKYDKEMPDINADALIGLLAVSSVFCQQLPYRKFSEFNGNIGAYLQYNFNERGKDLYVGHTFGQLIADLEITPTMYEGQNVSEVDGNSYQMGITLYFIKKGTKVNPLKDDRITIFWDTQILSHKWSGPKGFPGSNRNAKHYNTVKELEASYTKYDWVKQHDDFYKDYKIKSVWVNDL